MSCGLDENLVSNILEFGVVQLYQMNVKTVFFNGDIDECIYISQPPNYESDDSKQMVFKLKKSIYGLKQASR
jgi:Reverse transcriptase (RNA-dependent DNA polymerase)